MLLGEIRSSHAALALSFQHLTKSHQFLARAPDALRGARGRSLLIGRGGFSLIDQALGQSDEFFQLIPTVICIDLHGPNLACRLI